MELKSICDVFTYTYEAQLLDLLEVGEFDVRFLGDDYIGKPFTGDHLDIEINYINRDHGWSTTKFKKLIAETIR
jgi:glycerol-3-phosphate cytidylyltransferase